MLITCLRKASSPTATGLDEHLLGHDLRLDAVARPAEAHRRLAAGGGHSRHDARQRRPYRWRPHRRLRSSRCPPAWRRRPRPPGRPQTSRPAPTFRRPRPPRPCPPASRRPMPDDAPAKVVPKPRPAPSGATSPMVTPKGAPATKWFRFASAEAIIMMHQDSVTSTVLTELVTAPTPKKPWTALYRSPSGVSCRRAGRRAGDRAGGVLQVAEQPVEPRVRRVAVDGIADRGSLRARATRVGVRVGSVNGVTCAAVAAEAA